MGCNENTSHFLCPFYPINLCYAILIGLIADLLFYKFVVDNLLIMRYICAVA